jgi:hypothetical protein
MATSLGELHDRLRVAAALLDSAAALVRDIPLAPPKENIRHIADALAAIFDVLRAVYIARPELTPGFLTESSAFADANKRLTSALGEAIRLAEAGDTTAAAEALASYAASEESSTHKGIALYERSRLTGDADT